MADQAVCSGFTVQELRAVRDRFPILGVMARGKPLVYLDSAATTQKPIEVIEAEAEYYKSQNANVHRGIHFLSQVATERFEHSRERIRSFINARSRHELIFTKGCTEAINLVANSYGMSVLKPGDSIVLTYLEHHSNIVPWQMIAERTGASIRVIEVSDEGDLIDNQIDELIAEGTKIVAVTHVSNAIGTVNPVKRIISRARQVGAAVLIDGAQAIAHQKVDVQDLDADFYAFSAHKMYGPTGVGVLYGKEALLDSMPPYQGGGDMIRTVTFERTSYNDLPYKFEAGTPNVAGVVAMAPTVDFLESIGYEKIGAHEASLASYAFERLESEAGVRLMGAPKNRSAIVSFLMECAHAHDVATVLDTEGIAIRSGHHCSMPLMKRFGVSSTSRASFGVYNSIEEVDRLVAGLAKVRSIFE